MKTLKHLFLALILFFSIHITFSQVAINTDGSVPDASAMLDVSSTDKGLLVPSMTRAQRNLISSPATGLIVFQTDDTTGFYFYHGSDWVPIGAETISINDLLDGKTVGENMYLGDGAGYNDDGTEKYNVALGDSAMFATTYGNFITAIGNRALRNNQSGANTAVGAWAMYSNTTGSVNTAIGTLAMRDNTWGNSNTAIGYQTLYKNTLGGMNTTNGFEAMFWNTTGSSNIAIGLRALYNNKANSRSTAVGYSAMFNADSRETERETYNTAVGYEALKGGATPLENTGQHNTAVGDQALFANISGYNNTAIGSSALTNNTSGLFNLAAGASALKQNTSGYSNSALGTLALEFNTTGLQNTAAGTQALRYNTTGNNNAAFGFQALVNNSSGNSNTSFGYQSLYSNTTGCNNSAYGDSALYSNTSGSYNAAYGFGALYNNTAERNTAIGVRALMLNDTGTMNTAVGFHALINNTTGNYNTAVGYSASHSGNYSNTTGLGHYAVPTASNSARIGDGGITWIGGQVAWSAISDGRAKTGIKEDVKGLDFVLKLRPVTYYWDKDRLDAIMGIDDRSDYPEKYDIEKMKISGFIAQEVEQAALETGYEFSGVSAPVNNNTPYSLSYGQFVVPLVKAVQELSDRNDQLVEKVGRQQEQIDMLMEKLELMTE